MKDRVLNFWRSCNDRERRFLAAGGILLFLVGGYLYVWSPLQQSTARLRTSVVDLKHKARQFEIDAKEAQRLKGMAPRAVVTVDLSAAIEQEAEKFGMRSGISSLAPVDANRIRIEIQAVGVDKLLSWIEALQGRGIFVKTIGILPAGSPGMVNADAVLGYS